MTEIPRGIAPSILSADFARLGEQVQLVLDAGAKTIHFDVMDGHFVPPITVGPDVLKAIAAPIHAAGAIVDVHLMVDRPERHVEAFVAAGADRILCQVESTPHIAFAVKAIRDAGRSPGVVINPGTPVEAIAELVDEVDVILCMTVNPGWGGQAFLPSSIDKIARLKALVGDRALIEVDGGVDATTAGACAQAGAEILVAGSAIFHAADPVEAFHRISTAGGYG
ncbi:MAG: ribulose-phosphate 3-epimerase [Solirubrobacterales bacterium]|jgi:ribulose-phosphate 3-epimerase|nr:ribulose-phosphate 3-epimerase [Solirubrobacterales bacterium]